MLKFQIRVGLILGVVSVHSSHKVPEPSCTDISQYRCCLDGIGNELACDRHFPAVIVSPLTVRIQSMPLKYSIFQGIQASVIVAAIVVPFAWIVPRSRTVLPVFIKHPY